MPHPTRSGLGEAAITATLLSIYLSARGTTRALGAVHAATGSLEPVRFVAATSRRRGHDLAREPPMSQDRAPGPSTVGFRTALRKQCGACG